MVPTQLWQTATLDDHIWAQPLVYGSRVYVATENDSMYALDAATGAVVWHRRVGTPVVASALCGGDIVPNVGITSTPVIDPATNAIYAVADTWDGTNPSSIQHVMVGLSLADGSPVMSRVVDPPGSVPADQLQRASLALDGNEVVIGYGGNDSDCGTYHGWLVASAVDGTGALLSHAADPNTLGGAIWGSGNGPAVDPEGNIYIATGNGFQGSVNNAPSAYDGSETVARLDRSLWLLDYWAPPNWQALDASDTDIGSSEPVLLPGGLLFQSGKDGTGYLLHASALGGIGAPAAELAGVCPQGSFGGSVYQALTLYVACVPGGLEAVSVSGSPLTLAHKPGWTVTSGAIGPPVIAGGLVWTAGFDNGVLYGLNPADGSVSFQANLGGFMHFATPAAGGGRLFVANDNRVTAFTIATPPPPSPTTTHLVPPANPSLRRHRVRLTAVVLPRPVGGTIRFMDAGHTVPGCGALAVNPVTEGAVCTTSFAAVGSHRIVATYSGDSFLARSRSAKLIERIINVRPIISRVWLSPRSFRSPGGTTLRLTVSDRARLTITIKQLVHGRLRPRLTLHRHTRAGYNRFKLRLGTLGAGRYVAILIARRADGTRSKPSAVSFVVR
jgi:outer membrane protein assembly factor BamB